MLAASWEGAEPGTGVGRVLKEEVGEEGGQEGRFGPCVEDQNRTGGGWVCVLESGDSREVFEKGSGVITESSEEMHLLIGHSVIELRETRGRMSGQASRSKQQKEVV